MRKESADDIIKRLDQNERLSEVGRDDDLNYPDFSTEIEQDKLELVNPERGADPTVRAMVGAAQTPQDKLETLRNYYPDAVPVEIFSPQFGAQSFGKGNFVITDPQTNEMHLFDADIRLFGTPIPDIAKEFVGDLADVGPEIAEFIGGTAGGIYGATVGTAVPVAGTTAGFIAGEGLGSAIAREGYISALNFLGETEDNRTGLEQVRDFGTTAAINMAAGPIVSKTLDGIKFVAGGPIRYAAGGLSRTAKEALKIMKRTGVSAPTAGQVTMSPFINLFESAASGMPFSTNVMRQNAEQTLLELEKQALDRAEALGGGKLRTTYQAAEANMSAAQKARQAYNDKVDELYKDFEPLIPSDLVSEASNTAEFILKYTDEMGAASTQKDVQAIVNTATSILRDATEGKLNYKILKAKRQSIGQDLRSAQSVGVLDAQGSKLKELYAAITKDFDALIDNAARVTDDVNITKGFEKANEYVKNNLGAGGDIRYIDKVISAGRDEVIPALKLVLRGSKDGDEALRKIKNKYNEEEFDILRGYILGQLGTPTAGRSGATSLLGEAAEPEGMIAKLTRGYVEEKGFSPKRFLTQYESLSKEAKEILFANDKGLAKSLDDLIFSIERVSASAENMSNPSGTARMLGATAFFSPQAVSLYSGAAGSEAFLFGIVALAGSHRMAKLLTNQSFVKWLAEGTEKVAFDPASFGQHVRRLAQIALVNPEIREEIQAVTMGLTEETLEEPDFKYSTSNQQAQDIPLNNEDKFRQRVPASVANKLLPSENDLMAELQSIQVPDIDPMMPIDGGYEIPQFEPLPSVMQGSADSQFAMSPTVLPNAGDREIAMRQMEDEQGGIASLG